MFNWFQGVDSFSRVGLFFPFLICPTRLEGSTKTQNCPVARPVPGPVQGGIAKKSSRLCFKPQFQAQKRKKKRSLFSSSVSFACSFVIFYGFSFLACSTPISRLRGQKLEEINVGHRKRTVSGMDTSNCAASRRRRRSETSTKNESFRRTHHPDTTGAPPRHRRERGNTLTPPRHCRDTTQRMALHTWIWIVLCSVDLPSLSVQMISWFRRGEKWNHAKLRRVLWPAASEPVCRPLTSVGLLQPRNLVARWPAALESARSGLKTPLLV